MAVVRIPERSWYLMLRASGLGCVVAKAMRPRWPLLLTPRAGESLLTLLAPRLTCCCQGCSAGTADLNSMPAASDKVSASSLAKLDSAGDEGAVLIITSSGACSEVTARSPARADTDLVGAWALAPPWAPPMLELLLRRGIGFHALVALRHR